MSKTEFEFDLPTPLPDEWKWLPLEDLMDEPKQDIVDGPFGSNLKASEYVEEGIPIARLQNVDRNVFVHKNIKYVTREKADELSRHTFEPGDILITKLGDPLGEACIAPPSIKHGVIVADLVRVRPAEAKVDRRYLTYAINSPLVARQFERHTKGTTRPRVNLGMIRKLPIPVAPRGMQAGVVAEIEKQFSRLDEAVANLKRVKANLKRYKAAVLKAAVEGRLVETEAELARREGRSYETGEQLLQRILETRRSQWKGKGKYKEPAAPDTTDLPELPEGWVYACIDQLLPPERDAMKTGPFGSLLKKHEHQDEGVPVLGIENIEAMRFVRGSKIHVSVKKADELSGYAVTSRDVLISRSGTVGEVCVVPNGLGEARISTNLMKVSLAKKGMLPEFFVLLFNGSPFVLNQVSDLCKGSTRDFLNQEILRQINFTCPPLSEQIRIVAEVDRRLSLVGEIEAQVDGNATRTECLRQSVLQQAFTGRLDTGEMKLQRRNETRLTA